MAKNNKNIEKLIEKVEALTAAVTKLLQQQAPPPKTPNKNNTGLIVLDNADQSKFG